MFVENNLVTETARLQKFALRLTKNKDDANDLVQSTCLRALEKAHYFEEGTNLFRWTSKIMFNLFVTGYRRKSKFETQFDPQPYLEAQSIQPVQDTNMEVADIKRAMKKLSPEYREILTLICAQEMRYEEVAQMLKIPVGTVRSRLFRARERLQTLMNTPPSVSTSAQIMRVQKLANENMPIIPAYLVAQARQKHA